MEETLTPDEEPAVHQSDLDVNELQCHFAEKAADKLKEVSEKLLSKAEFIHRISI